MTPELLLAAVAVITVGVVAYDQVTRRNQLTGPGPAPDTQPSAELVLLARVVTDGDDVGHAERYVADDYRLTQPGGGVVYVRDFLGVVAVRFGDAHWHEFPRHEQREARYLYEAVARAVHTREMAALAASLDEKGGK